MLLVLLLSSVSGLLSRRAVSRPVQIGAVGAVETPDELLSEAQRLRLEIAADELDLQEDIKQHKIEHSIDAVNNSAEIKYF